MAIVIEDHFSAARIRAGSCPNRPGASVFLVLQPAPIDYDPVISLAVSPFEADLSFLQRMFDDADWKLFTVPVN